MKIGILGGSFDPVHNGHIVLAKSALKQLKLDLLFFVPAYMPPHKNRKLEKAFHRKRMLSLATRSYKKFLISDFELNRKRKTYTYQTIEYFYKKYFPVDLYLIIGSDSAIDLKNWKNDRKIIQLSKVVVGKRDNYIFNNKDNFILLSGKIPDISSTGIRRKIEDGFSARGLISSSVGSYIKRNGLYM
ncbi:MAG: nicotinate (nicotinamide) nucleotide adenylyltransferase [Elusimicrobia bacterium]|nr:nicotinate (nicotinamide) nucleotide adenylyltransferase [Elusimicrobiota bacterium]